MRTTAALALALVPVLLGACTRPPEPNIVLISIGSLRADRLGATGAPDARTPALDGLAARGVLFERAYASSPITLPSHATILTGLQPPAHGVRDDGEGALPPGIETLAERLAARGYDSGAFVGTSLLASSYGLARGFAVYQQAFGRNAGGPSGARRPAEEVASAALEWLEADREGPFFLWVELHDLGFPRKPPPPYDGFGNDYAGALAYVDTQIGRLLGGIEATGAERETLIVALGDHGEGLGEHDEPTHGLVAYDSTLRVPLIAAGPGFPPGLRDASFVQTSDVAATILAAIGDAEGLGGDGIPLAERLEGDAQAGSANRVGYFETFAPLLRFAWSPIRGVRDGRWKVTLVPAPAQLYDVLADPDESENRAETEPEVVARLARAYDSALSSWAEAGAPAAPQQPSDPPPVSSAGGAKSGTPLDPRRVAPQLALVGAARVLARAGDVDSSLEMLEVLVRRDTLHVPALESLAEGYRARGRIESAIDALSHRLALTGSVGARLDLAAAQLEAERFEDALATLEEVELGSPRIHLVRGESLRRLGRLEEAEKQATAALAVHPFYDSALALRGLARAARLGTSAEIPQLEQVLASAPRPDELVRTRGVLAQLLRDAGRDSDAATLLRPRGDTPPDQKVMLAELYVEHGRVPMAVRLYESALSKRRDPAWLRELADLYLRSKKADRALPLYDELIARAPDDASLYLSRGAARHEAGDPAGGEADYRQALSLDDGIPELHYNLALVEQAAGREDQAERHLQRAVVIRPDYPKAHLFLARIYDERGDPRAALHAELALVTDEVKRPQSSLDPGEN